MTLELKDPSLLKNQAYVNGQWIEGAQDCIPVLNPATGETVAEFSGCGTAETRAAIDAASDAFEVWRKVPFKQRQALLRKWFNLILDNKEDLGKILTAEQGKIRIEAEAEVIYGADYIEWFAEEAARMYGDVIPSLANDQRIVCIKQPVGVVACVTPWNFPSAMLTRKIAPALAAGCTVVCKPANETPLSAFALAELAERAGIPAGVINMVAGNTQEIGGELTSSPKVHKLTFTGSTKVGKILIKQCAETVKKTSMELGGNSAFIVFDDADIDKAVAGAMVTKFRNAGQTCVCTNRIFVQSKIHDEFAEKLTQAVSELNTGNGADANSTMGPLVHTGAVEGVDALVQDAVAKGGRITTGGKRMSLGPCFYEPTVIVDGTDEMEIFSEEIFGPVAVIYKFETEEEVIRRANNSPYGLAGYFYTRDIGRVWRVGEALECGILGINEGRVSNAMAPFGGVKESGNGREGSKYGLEDYTEIKYMCLGGIE